jgi:KaiC/GvpD/RAD55 family RecA-like ATPase
MKLLKTGIAGLDEFLQGGLPPRVFLLLGTPGSGSDVFARQVAYSRAKEAGISYFTVTRSIDSVKEDMSTYGWQIAPLEKAGNWRFAKITQANPLIDTVIGEMKQNRSIVLDSLSELTLTHKTQEIASLLNTMSAQNKEQGELHLILMTEGMQDRKTEVTMEHFADGVIIFRTTEGTEVSAKHIMVKKIRGTSVPNRMLPYSIGEKGFTIETATRIT